jgi:hypothetical protein
MKSGLGLLSYTFAVNGLAEFGPIKANAIFHHLGGPKAHDSSVEKHFQGRASTRRSLHYAALRSREIRMFTASYRRRWSPAAMQGSRHSTRALPEFSQVHCLHKPKP